MEDEMARDLNVKRTIWQEVEVVNGRNNNGRNDRRRNGRGRSRHKLKELFPFQNNGVYLLMFSLGFWKQLRGLLL